MLFMTDAIHSSRTKKLIMTVESVTKERRNQSLRTEESQSFRIEESQSLRTDEQVTVTQD